MAQLLAAPVTDHKAALDFSHMLLLAIQLGQEPAGRGDGTAEVHTLPDPNGH